MIEQKSINDLEINGVTVVPSVLSSDTVLALKNELAAAIEQDREQYGDVFDKGMVHNCMSRGTQMAAILDNPLMNAYLKECFSDTCIIYAYQSSSLPPNKGNYGSRVHVDCPRFIEGYTTNMGIMFPLDDFTKDNGATFYVPGSHLQEKIPSDDDFFDKAKQVICSAGDMIILNARLVHAAGINRTSHTRHALTINFCRSFMRQRFDLPRLLPSSVIDSLGEDGRRLVGMNVRVPTSLAEFYLPESERLYKANQG